MIIKNGCVITPVEIIKCNIRVINDKTMKIGNVESDDDEIIDASDCYVSPNFVDIHTHGGGDTAILYEGDEQIKIPYETIVSMNCWRFIPIYL